jgi:hypothetical protein
MQLRLDLAEFPAPAAVLWELVGEAERRAAIAQLSALIAEAVVGPVVERPGEQALLAGAGARGGSDGWGAGGAVRDAETQ